MVKFKQVSIERVQSAIVLLRGQRVILDAELAALYGVETRALVQAVRRNAERFPADFTFRLTLAEARRFYALKEQHAESTGFSGLKSHSVISNERGRGGRRSVPYAFTEQGVAMLSSVLRSPRAVQVNIEIMRAFVRLRLLLQSNVELARKLDALEQKYDEKFRVVFDAIRELMSPDKPPKRRIGFGPGAE
jgi:hypothetical protein